MQNSNQISKKIAQNREVFRAEIRAQKNEDLFTSKRLKFQFGEKEDVGFSDDHLITQLLETSDVNDIKPFLEELRKRSCEFEKNPTFLENNRIFLLIPVLVRFLETPELEYSSCWILINLLIGDTTLIKFCINSGLLQAFLKIIEKRDIAMCEQALWGIANMAGDSPEILSTILQEGTVDKIWNLLQNIKLMNIEISKNTIWFLKNVMSGKNYNGDLVIIIRMVGIIIENNCFEEELFESCSQVLSQVGNRQPNGQNFLVVWNEVSMLLLKITCYFNSHFEKLTEKTISYCLNFILIFLNDDEIIELTVKVGIISLYRKTVLNPSPKVRQASFLALGNIFGSNAEVIDFCFKSSQSIFKSLLETIQKDTHFKVKTEAIICLSNLVAFSSSARLSELLEIGVLETITSILDIYDPDLLSILLETLQELFRFGNYLAKEESSQNPVLMAFKHLDGIKKLEDILIKHTNEKIKQKTTEIIISFQSVEVEEV